MENSASMDGYVNGTTEFKDVLGKMIVSSHHYCKSTDFYFVNNAIYKADGNAISFIQMLNPAKIKVGNVGSTDVNHIFRNILAKTNKDTVSVLFSDCIYSVKNVTNELDNSKNAGAPDKPCGEAVQMLTQNCCQTIHEEWYVLDSFYLCTEAFYL